MKPANIKIIITTCIFSIFISSSYSDQALPVQNKVEIEELKESVKNMDNPIILDHKGIKTFEQLENLIDDYIRKNHDGQVLRGSSLSKENGKYILTCATFNEDDKMLILAFDVTKIFNKLLKSSDKKTKEEIKKYIASFDIES
ncbi:hypothetical protein [Akkermansia sp.]|uniref:hypothetical protein n=1 Tax=Akkermansia sp. TaxID=1872421 RepID=UPI0025BD8079|nr:hypothetical protein [Akkermansia sp.]